MSQQEESKTNSVTQPATDSASQPVADSITQQVAAPASQSVSSYEELQPDPECSKITKSKIDFTKLVIEQGPPKKKRVQTPYEMLHSSDTLSPPLK